MKYINEQERRRRIKLYLGEVKYVRNAKAEEPSVPGLAEASLKVLIKAALEIGIALLAIYEGLGFPPGKGKRAVDDLRARAMVRTHQLVREGRGGRPQVLEVLPRGLEELAKRGITPAEKKLKGKFKHDVYGRILEKWVRAQGDRFWFERTLGGKTFDGVREDKEGLLFGYEVVLTGSAKWNAQQALKAASVQGIEQVIVLCEDKKLLKAIEGQIEELDGLGLYRKKIVGKWLAEFVA